MPSKVFTDQELTAIGAAMLRQRDVELPFMQDSQGMRTAYSNNPYPLARPTAQPAECGPFHPPAIDEALGEPTMNFATGGVPLAGASGPTTTILFTLRSAPADMLAQADFDYNADLVSRCAQFEVTSESYGPGSPYTVMLLEPPSVGEKAYALMSPSEGSLRPLGGVGLRVLAGTVSISMGLSVSALNSEADAQPALESMAGIAQQLIDQAVRNPPTVSPPPPNDKTPAQLTTLLQNVTGPGGSRVVFASGSVIGAVPGSVPTPSGPIPTRVSCTFSEAAYYSSLIGSTTAQGQFSGPSKADYFTVLLISMSTTATPPYPFDARAADLRDCSTIQEEADPGPRTTGADPTQWGSIHRLSVNVTADSVYAIAHQPPDGGVWHLLVGARKGDLSVELDATRNTEADLQSGADDMAAVINQVFNEAGG